MHIFFYYADKLYKENGREDFHMVVFPTKNQWLRLIKNGWLGMLEILVW